MMTLTLVISYKDKNIEDEYTPIASVGGELQAFNGIWLPIAEKHRLGFIKTFGAGINLLEYLNDIPNIIGELNIMLEVLPDWQHVSEDRLHLAIARVTTLISKLKYIQENSPIIERAAIF